MINTDNYELYCFRYAEGMLGEAERREVEAFLSQHPDLAEELQLYAEAPKVGREAVSFPDKESLKRSEPKPRSMWWKAAAAVAAIAAVCVALFNGIDKPQTPQLAEVLPPKTTALPQTSEDRTDTLPSQRPCAVVETAAPTLASCTRRQKDAAPLLAENVAVEEVGETLAEVWDDEEELLDPATTMALAQAILAEHCRTLAEAQSAMPSEVPTPAEASVPAVPAEELRPTLAEALQERVGSLSPSVAATSRMLAEATMELASWYAALVDFKEEHRELVSIAEMFI